MLVLSCPILLFGCVLTLSWSACFPTRLVSPGVRSVGARLVGVRFAAELVDTTWRDQIKSTGQMIEFSAESLGTRNKSEQEVYSSWTDIAVALGEQV